MQKFVRNSARKLANTNFYFNKFRVKELIGHRINSRTIMFSFLLHLGLLWMLKIQPPLCFPDPKSSNPSLREVGAMIIHLKYCYINWNWERSQMKSSKIRGFQTPSPLRHLPSLLPYLPRWCHLSPTPLPFSQDEFRKNCFSMVKITISVFSYEYYSKKTIHLLLAGCFR